MHIEKTIKTINSLSVEERMQTAAEKTEKLVDVVRLHLFVHANNKQAIYSNRLIGMIPKSYAAHAFNHFTLSMLHYEFMRITAFWDEPDFDSHSIPTIIMLIDDLSVRKHIIEKHSSWLHWEEERKSIHLRKINRNLRDTILECKKYRLSQDLEQVKNFRHKLAHLLDQTNTEKKGVKIQSPKYRDEQKIFRKTQKITDKLYLYINGTGFDWNGAKKHANRSAKALWNGTTIKVLE